MAVGARAGEGEKQRFFRGAAVRCTVNFHKKPGRDLTSRPGCPRAAPYFPRYRHKRVTICPRVQVSPGEKVTSLVPVTMLLLTAQLTAWAQDAEGYNE